MALSSCFCEACRSSQANQKHTWSSRAIRKNTQFEKCQLQGNPGYEAGYLTVEKFSKDNILEKEKRKPG